MKKFISFLYLLLIIKFAAFGQSDPQITHFTEFKMGFNPGFAGTEGNINGIVLNRYQWEGFKGAPKTLIFSANAAVNMFGSPGGLGVNFINDQIGFEKNTTININYS
ncbi:MAG: hypothetical protein CSA36_08010 [Draconibacterium sp.]|nr:MAG: hypothetical protein CSA36_08010 [Draconibacterium sp.]